MKVGLLSRAINFLNFNSWLAVLLAFGDKPDQVNGVRWQIAMVDDLNADIKKVIST